VSRTRRFEQGVRVLFDLRSREQDGWTVVAVTGELDLASAPKLRQELVRHVAAGHVRIVLDLSGTDFLDSIGLGVIVGAVKRVRAAGGDLVVVVANPRLEQLFSITMLDQILSVAPTFAEAITRVGGLGGNSPNPPASVEDAADG
jgi:anti-sigma B factor antagonist